MTTYILSGGNDSQMTDAQVAKLRAAILSGLNNEPRVLSVSFALLREDWEWKFRDRRTPAFQRLFDKNYDARLAYPDTFREDVKWANVIYIHGGDDTLLAHYLDKYEDLKELLAGKIVIGASAGADYLSQIFWTCDWRTVMNGRGLVKAAVITHFDSEYGKDDPRGPVDWAAAKHELAAETDLPIYLIREGDIEVFEKGE
ncbi:Type 1 glutamine amidotransferase-like domain-containing protein [Candidatus Saccharibacteria bacterium]|nr:Type 1 glutamine amidotransferase-like domain-containing protein [Candidatus Saccharibacteria bacterium]